MSQSTQYPRILPRQFLHVTVIMNQTNLRCPRFPLFLCCVLGICKTFVLVKILQYFSLMIFFTRKHHYVSNAVLLSSVPLGVTFSGQDGGG